MKILKLLLITITSSIIYVSTAYAACTNNGDAAAKSAYNWYNPTTAQKLDGDTIYLQSNTCNGRVDFTATCVNSKWTGNNTDYQELYAPCPDPGPDPGR